MIALDRKLELFSHEEPSAEAVQEAQRKLEQLIAGAAAPRRQKKRVGGWLAAAASAAAAVMAVVWLPLNPQPALAFSEVQKHFREFHALRFDIEQRVNGDLLMKSHVNVLDDGSVRTEVGENIVVVVNTREKRVLTLVKPERIAVVTPLPEPGTREDAMEWLDGVRNFQGMATALPGTRSIQGQRAHGWELSLSQGKGDGKIVLWANDQGLPLEMKIEQGAAMDMSFHFEFEPSLPADFFSTEVPAGYTLGTEED